MRIVTIIILFLLSISPVWLNMYSPRLYRIHWDIGNYKQELVNKAYELWWMRFVLMIDCENVLRDYHAIWDQWRAHWLCQMNTRRHKLPSQYYTDPMYQVEYCYKKFIWWTKFYWPSRKSNWVRCSKYSRSHFSFY